MGGGPGFTVHRMGGNRPRARPRDASEPPPSGFAALTQLLPLLLLFVLPLLSSFFTGSTPSGPQFRYQAAPPHTMRRVTPRYKIDYYLNPAEVDGYSSRQFGALDQCENEVQRQRHEINEATGFFFTDENRLQRARNMPMPGCQRLDELKIHRQY
jgi:DnaJ homolog subfamily B member 12